MKEHPPDESGVAVFTTTPTRNTRRTDTIANLTKIKLEMPPENGIHTWLVSASRRCRFNGMSAQETANHLASLQYRRRVPQSEIMAAVNLVFATATITTTTTSRTAPKPEKPAWMKTATDTIHADWQTTEQDLIDMSDVHPQDIDQRALLECLFPAPGALVCIAAHMKYGGSTTSPLAAHKDLASKQFIVPCYMTARQGITAEGKTSCRAKSITGDRRFIVFDFDEPPSAHHPSIIRWLMGTRAPLLVLSSGGKSLHAWYATTESDEKFWQLGIMAGADPALKANHAQAVRLPMGTRDNGNAQRIIYFNPNNLPT